MALNSSKVPINHLLQQLESLIRDPSQDLAPSFAHDIGVAISQIFTNQLSDVQSALLLHDLYHTRLEQHPEVLKECARVMTDAAELPNADELRQAIKGRNLGHGDYHGGLVR